MNSPTAPIHATRLLLVALALLAAATAVAAAEPAAGDQFAPGWQAHAKPLFYMGPAMRAAGRDKYMMPGILPAGDYVLVRREGDKATLLDAAVVTVHGGNEKQYIFLDPGSGDVQALPVTAVPAPKAASAGR